ncbi:MAG: hypothetical protein COU32_00300 [Candidatus Magasanikbacteria bacterium CG10_big_fil_rev_8_21_14_0_10_42_10]|uniref:DUF4430 domain-containing protein n=2 Tax=Candidatus Magasanikiibacteriota TaxID=1752731 RepID=A0A2H0TX71_9BACT|nr:MAG: hypothetical protein COU32_00300 [Candidatus Magasanikbacteria bacterium CG10_big_fil_rev_8_21_14_0_10_42_10]PIZ94199.1 MAG: hypothetical protein COX82_01190 [Candidatus Magasanikbacteria bacterium CG_4_10_14_0_2_um_filter_41_10]
MRVPRLLTLTLLILPFMGAGCSKPAAEVSYTYSVNIVTAVDQRDTRVAALQQEEVMMDELLHAVGIQSVAQPRGEEVVLTSFNNVIATKSKTWQLYINNTLTPLTQLEHMPVRASDTIEWKYESQ